MKRYSYLMNAFCFEGIECFLREVKGGCGRGHGPFPFRKYRLVIRIVLLVYVALAGDIGRQWHLAYVFKARLQKARRNVKGVGSTDRSGRRWKRP